MNASILVKAFKWKIYSLHNTTTTEFSSSKKYFITIVCFDFYIINREWYDYVAFQCFMLKWTYLNLKSFW